MTPRKVLKQLEEVVGLSGQPRRLREAIEKELQDYFGLGALEAAEQAERLEQPIKQLIISQSIEREEKGTVPILAFSKLSSRTIMGSCFVEDSDDPETTLAKQRRLQIEPMITHIQALTFKEFEEFGAKVLRELGASIVKVTPQSSDQGIDFYGILSLGEVVGAASPFRQLAHDVTLRFAGQAKHYPTTPIGPSVVRELIGSISLARHRVFSVESDLFEDLELQAFDPLLGLLFTTGRFTRGGAEVARKAGIIARSVEQLAVFLTDCSVGIAKSGESLVFDEDLFRNWLNA